MCRKGNVMTKISFWNNYDLLNSLVKRQNATTQNSCVTFFCFEHTRPKKEKSSLTTLMNSVTPLKTLLTHKKNPITSYVFTQLIKVAIFEIIESIWWFWSAVEILYLRIWMLFWYRNWYQISPFYFPWIEWGISNPRSTTLTRKTYTLGANKNQLFFIPQITHEISINRHKSAFQRLTLLSPFRY